jgi:hypothetical protein
MFASGFYLDVAYVSHMLQEYILNVSSVYVGANVFMLQVVSVYLEVAYVAVAIMYVVSVCFSCF